MSQNFVVLLLDTDNKVIESIVIEKPKTFGLLLKAIKYKLNKLPNDRKHFNLFYLSSNSDNIYSEINVNNNEEYKTIKDFLFIRINESFIKEQSFFSDSYSKLAEEKKDIIDQRYSCNICCEVIKEKPLFCPSCQKLYHDTCLKDWEKRNTKFACPSCKVEVPLNKWKIKKYHDENRIKDIEIMNQMKAYKLINLINDKKIELLQKELQSKNEKLKKELDIPDIFINILRQITDITSLIKPLMDKRLIEVIKKFKELSNYILKFSEYRNEINITYLAKEEGINNIFGKKFEENNKNNIDLLINNKNSPLVSQCTLKEGNNNIKLIIKNNLNNLEHMFYGCNSLINIEELKYLDTRKVTNYSYMFYGCSSLSDVKPLEQWEVSNGNNFSNMFSESKLTSELQSFNNWKNFVNKDNSCSILIEDNSLNNSYSEQIFATMISKKLGKIKSDF